MVQLQKCAKIKSIKCIGSQLLATVSMHVMYLSVGMAYAFPTIVLPALLDHPKELVLTDEQASWFSSIGSLVQLFGAVVSGPVIDTLGRKNSVFVLAVPLLVSWLMFYYVQGVGMLLLAAGLNGFGAGTLETPINGYVCEVGDPSMRTVLSYVAQWFNILGALVTSILATKMQWRQLALLSLAPCLIALLLIVLNLMPESPEWLLMNGREDEALESLRALRGWTSAEEVQLEYRDIVALTAARRACVLCPDEAPSQGCRHDQMNFLVRFALKVRLLFLTRSSRRPFILLMNYFLFVGVVTNFPLANFINICDALGMVAGGNSFLINNTAMLLFTVVAFAAACKVVGKRKMAISGFLLMAVSLAALSAYARICLDPNIFSYDVKTFSKKKSYVPTVLFYLYNCFCVFNVGWNLLGEILPLRSRAIAQGFAAALFYISTFAVTKLYITIEIYMKLWGAMAFFAVISFVAVVYLYLFLPETEGKTLTEVEKYFNGETYIFANDPLTRCFKRKNPIKTGDSYLFFLL